MKIANRLTLIKIHTLLASIMLPIISLFMITGVLETWGVKGNKIKSSYVLKLEKPLQIQLSSLVGFSEKELTKKNISLPTGAVKIKKNGDSFKLEWSGVKRDVILSSSKNLLSAKLEIIENSKYQQLVQLHKAKGGVVFKIYISSFIIILFILLFTGFLMAWQIPKMRKTALTSTIIGMTIFILMIIIN